MIASDIQLSNALHHAAQKAIDYALKALDGAEPLVPFAMSWRDGDTTIDRFKFGAYDDSIELAMHAVNNAAEDLNAYAVVWNGYVEIDGQRREAVVAEVADRHTPRSIQLAQPYRVEGQGSAAPDGALLALGEAQNLLLSKFSALTQANHLIKPTYITTEGFVTDVRSQPFAQMPVALICLAANLFDGDEQARITLGIRKLQSLEGIAGTGMSHRVFTVIVSAIAGGDLMEVLPTDDIEGMAEIVVNGAAQLRTAVQKGLVWDEHAQSYFADVKSILLEVLTNGGTEAMPEGGAKLAALFDKAAVA